MGKKEVWKDIRGYTGKYQVSTFGRIKSLKRTVKTGTGTRTVNEKILKLCRHPKGYVIVELFNLNHGTSKTVHRLVAKAFKKNPHRRKFINHLDGDKKNNRSDNLAWSTASGNMYHAYAFGLR